MAKPERPVIYLDNASTTWPKPRAVAEAMSNFILSGAATPGRGGYAMSSRNADLVARLRSRLAALIGAPNPDRVILTPGATDSFNMAILGLFTWPTSPLGFVPKVVTTVLEHNAIRRPLAFLKARGLIEVVEAPCESNGRVLAERILAEVDDRTVLVATMSASNVVGTVVPTAEVFRRLRATRPDVLTLLDASQTCGVLPIDVAADCIDLVAFPGHKALMGPTGTGALYISPRATGEEPGTRVTLQPTRFGGTGGDSGEDLMPKALPRRFEPGSINTVGFVGLLAALEASDRPTQQMVFDHEMSLARVLLDGLRDIPGVTLIGPRETTDRVPVVPFAIAGWKPTDAGAALDASAGIAVRCGLHCSPGAHRAMGSFPKGGAIRASPGVYNTRADVDALVGAVRELARAGA